MVSFWSLVIWLGQICVFLIWKSTSDRPVSIFGYSGWIEENKFVLSLNRYIRTHKMKGFGHMCYLNSKWVSRIKFKRYCNFTITQFQCIIQYTGLLLIWLFTGDALYIKRKKTPTTTNKRKPKKPHISYLSQKIRSVHHTLFPL